MPRSGNRPSKSTPNIASTTSSTAAPLSAASTVKQRESGIVDSAVLEATSRENPLEIRSRRLHKSKLLESVQDDVLVSMSWTARNQWVVYAVTSGACAAFNGVFAKLTTNDLTTHISQGISGFLGLKGLDRVLEIIVRCVFFGLNLAFNGVMWTLFTKALAKGHSTTQVSIMNTSTNFMITALLGLAIFAESLPPLWWAGATLLVAGNVIIGRKDEGNTKAVGEGESEQERAVEHGRVGVMLPEEKDDDEDEDMPLLGDLDDPRDR
ncbi:hypothetical protein F5Y19DRAFT_147690 [Xylariaceae sp. FL1651]|nr:hypothetical protein F5Y19DRAFT_147690 [Xylariaceae sp. FL1651]